MNNYAGDFAEDATVNIFFTTNDGSGGAVAPSTAFEAADVVIYKDNSDTQKTATDGITMTSPVDSTTGLHRVSIDTSNDTNDSGFWAAGSDYTVVLKPDETVDSQTVVHVIGTFSIQNRYPSVANILTTAMSESYASDGAAPTVAQALFGILQTLTEYNQSGTTVTVKKLDGSTTAMTLTLDSATTPTSVTRTG